MTSNIDSSKMEKVSSIASRFQGQSRVQPEQVFQLGLAERQSQGKRAAGEAAKIRESYRGKGDDLMSEFERNRRLEAEARRRAELEALSNLHRYSGSHALILAYQRAKLGLPLSEMEQKLLHESAPGLQLDIHWSAAQIEEERARALAFSLEQEEAALGAAAAPSSMETSFAHTLGADATQTAAVASSAASTPASATPPEAAPAEVRALLKLIAAILQQAGQGMTLGDISAAITEKTGKRWGQTFEPKHGPLLTFLQTASAGEAGLRIHQNKYVLLEGMSTPREPVAAASVGASAGYGFAPTPTPSRALTLEQLQFGAQLALQQQQQAMALQQQQLAMQQQAQQQQQNQSDSAWVGFGTGLPASSQGGVSAGTNPFEDAFYDPLLAAALAEKQRQERQRAEQAAAAAAEREKEARAATTTSRLSTTTGQSVSVGPERRLSMEERAFEISAEFPVQFEGGAARRTTRSKMVTETEQGVEIRPTREPPGPAKPVVVRPISVVPAAAGSRQGIGAPPSYGFDDAVRARGAPPSDWPTAAAYTSPVTSTGGFAGNGRGGANVAVARGGGPYGSSSSGMDMSVSSTSLGAGNNVDMEAERFAQFAVRGSGRPTDGDESLTWQDFDILFRPMLLHGFNLIKHGRSGLPKRRHMWFSNSMTKLYWDTSRIMDIMRTGERHIDIADVVSIVDGVGTNILQRKAGRGEIHTGNQERFFSLITTGRTYDFEAASVSQKKVLIRAISFLIRKMAHPALRGSQPVRVVPYTSSTSGYSGGGGGYSGGGGGYPGGGDGYY